MLHDDFTKNHEIIRHHTWLLVQIKVNHFRRPALHNREASLIDLDRQSACSHVMPMLSFCWHCIEYQLWFINWRKRIPCSHATSEASDSQYFVCAPASDAAFLRKLWCSDVHICDQDILLSALLYVFLRDISGSQIGLRLLWGFIYWINIYNTGKHITRRVHLSVSLPFKVYEIETHHAN